MTGKAELNRCRLVLIWPQEKKRADAASRLQAYRMIGATEHTHEHDGEREILDHVLVSEQFYDHSDNRLWSFEQMRIWNDHVADTDPASSDHGQVAARFLWDPTD